MSIKKGEQLQLRVLSSSTSCALSESFFLSSSSSTYKQEGVVCVRECQQVVSELECSSLVAMASLDREHGCGRSQERGRGRQMTYVVKKTVRDIDGAQYLMLTRTNYASGWC